MKADGIMQREDIKHKLLSGNVMITVNRKYKGTPRERVGYMFFIVFFFLSALGENNISGIIYEVYTLLFDGGRNYDV